MPSGTRHAPTMRMIYGFYRGVALGTSWSLRYDYHFLKSLGGVSSLLAGRTGYSRFYSDFSALAFNLHSAGVLNDVKSSQFFIIFPCLPENLACVWALARSWTSPTRGAY